MRSVLALAAALLLSGCAAFQSPDGATLDIGTRPGNSEGGTVTTISHAVPFADGRVLGLDLNHRPYWRPGGNPYGKRLAHGFRAPSVGDSVTILTAWAEIPAVVVAVNGPEALVMLAEDALPGYSGAGAWYADDWLAGIVMARAADDHRVALTIIPFVGTED